MLLFIIVSLLSIPVMQDCDVWVMAVREQGTGKYRARCFIPRNGCFQGLGVRNE